jgi:general secretion pathway protein G
VITPSHLAGNRRREKKRIRERIAREAERKMAAAGLDLPEFLTHRKAAHVFVLLTVLMVVGGLVVSQTNRHTRKTVRITPEHVAQVELDSLRRGLENFRRDLGRFPSSEEGLQVLVRNPGGTNWMGPYVNLIHPDPWRIRYAYRNDGTNLDLRSHGADRLPDTADDLCPSPDWRDSAGQATEVLPSPIPGPEWDASHPVQIAPGEKAPGT